MGESITVCDVAPRDGLQNDAVTLAPQTRAELCERLAATGLPRVEAASFVNPQRVPQMAGAEEVMEGIDRVEGVSYSGLVLNGRGYERALAAGVDEVHYAFPVTDTFAERNQGTTVEAAIGTAAEIVSRAHEDGLRVSVTLAASFGCPFEGRVATDHVISVAERVLAGAPHEIVLADTIGVGVPSQATELVKRTLALGAKVGCHFHNTRNTGFANAIAALEAGASLLDASVGGSGGCPFAPGAAGNIATEDLVYMLDGMGVETGIDLDALLDTARWLAEQLERELPSMTSKAPPFPTPA
jgi:isopropylmalate/homocitrate/citramalate synthase